MKTLVIFLFAVIANSAIGYGQLNPQNNYLDSYYHFNKTMEKGYYRPAYDNTINNSYSTYPNVNSSIGKTGNTEPTHSTFTVPNYYYFPIYTEPVLSPPAISYPISAPSYSAPTDSYPDYSYPEISKP